MPDVTVDDLRARVRGALIRPDDGEAYDEARSVYNAMHDRRPRLVVRAVDEGDVMATVDFARDRGLGLAVRGGAHSVPGFGTCDDGVVLDLSALRNVRVDPAARTARVGGGALLGDLDHATHAYGLATPAGFISSTGVGGLTLGGGFGYLSRKYGLTCDNLLSADVVTADGRRVTASEVENEDLFWALRGGGGNFGVVTSFEYRLHPVKNVVAGPVFFELDAAPDIIRRFRDYLPTAPRDLNAFFGFQIAPPLPFIPEERHGDTFAALVPCWCGDPDEADAALKPLLEAGPVVAAHVGRVPYPVIQGIFDPLLPAGLYHYWKSDFATGLPDEAIDAHLEYGPRVPAVQSTMHLYMLDGAIHDRGPEDTAFPCRDAQFAINVIGSWPDPADTEANVQWVRDYYEAIHPFSGYEGGYTNFMAGDDDDRVRANYGATYDRLAEVKEKWDPDNLFRLNQNIRPRGAAAAT